MKKKRLENYAIASHIGLGSTCTNTMLDAVICPNLCFDGMVKIYEYERALYDLVKCPYCNGKGKVSHKEANRIDALL